jgi:leucyl aminopeptidase (aminopeptidase T)
MQQARKQSGGPPAGRAGARLTLAARVAIEDVMRVRKGERVVIVTNPEHDVRTISEALYEASLARGAQTVMIVQPRRSSVELAADAVIHALRSSPDVIISMSAEKLGRDRFGLEKPYRFPGVKGKWTHIFDALRAAGKTRAFWSPSTTIDMFTRTVPVDYTAIRRQARRLKTALDRADRIQILAPGGTDIEIGLRGRAARLDDGAFWKPGAGGNLPAGETHISPANYDAQGLLVFDGSISVVDGGGAFVPRKPVAVTVAGGLVTAVRGGAGAARLERSLRMGEAAARLMRGKPGWSTTRVAGYVRNARHLGEMGIGLNPAARISGNMLEDEKVLGTCHIAIGSNYDDDAEAFIHLDCLIQSPTIITIGPRGQLKLIMETGRIV